jgi:hypothetical protein
MCEVEFWEVFLRESARVFRVVTLTPRIDCRLANLESFNRFYLMCRIVKEPASKTAQVMGPLTANISLRALL